MKPTFFVMLATLAAPGIAAAQTAVAPVAPVAPVNPVAPVVQSAPVTPVTPGPTVDAAGIPTPSPWGGPPGQLPPPPPPTQYAPPGYGTYAPPGLMPVPSVVPVRFAPAIGDDVFDVTATSPAGTQRCRAPCGLMLPPGLVRVSVSGAREYTNDLMVSPQPMFVRIRRFRSGRMVWGIVGLAVGVPLALAGLVLYSTASVCDTTYSYSCSPDATYTSGLLLSVLGSALAVTAAITGFTSMGSNRMEMFPDQGQLARNRGPRLTGIGLAAAPNGGASVGATFAF